MKIINMNRGEWGNIKAYFTLVTGDGIAINGMRVIEGANGLFVGYPSKQNKDGDYEPIVRPLDRNVSKGIQEEAVASYTQEDSKDIADSPVGAGFEHKNKKAEEETFDDGIPF